jgi:hypothetical protein
MNPGRSEENPACALLTILRRLYLLVGGVALLSSGDSSQKLWLTEQAYQSTEMEAS